MFRNTWFFLAIAFVAAAYGFWDFSDLRDVRSAAQAALESCANAKDHQKCFEQLIPALYPELSIQEVFEVVREVRRADPSYQFCHVLAHKIGERVVAGDPDAWVEAIPLNPRDGLCSNGFIHGVIGGRFRSEVLEDTAIQKLIPDFSRACAPRSTWSPSELDRAICYHGMGHLYDFVTNADLSHALRLCQETTPENFRRVCIEGVFMQIYQPLEPDDYELIKQMKVKPTKETVRQFCALFKDPRYVGACLRESWPMHEGMLDGTGVTDFCSGQPNAELEDHCYRGAFTIIGRLNLGEPESAASACERAPSRRQEMCYSVVAQSILEEDRTNGTDALAFCAKAALPLAEACRAWLVQTAHFIFGKDKIAHTRFCAILPSSLSQRCLDSI